MDRLRIIALITELVQQLRAKDNWCGETHIQKAVYFLETLFNYPVMGFGFVLYRHGPYSFDLSYELTAMRADGFLKLEPQLPPYGPRILATEPAIQFKNNYPNTLQKFQPQLTFIVDRLSDKGVSELEKLSTALLVTKEKTPGTSIQERAAEIHDLKPHISMTDAKWAVEEIERILLEAKPFEIKPPQDAEIPAAKVGG